MARASSHRPKYMACKVCMVALGIIVNSNDLAGRIYCEIQKHARSLEQLIPSHVYGVWVSISTAMRRIVIRFREFNPVKDKPDEIESKYTLYEQELSHCFLQKKYEYHDQTWYYAEEGIQMVRNLFRRFHLFKRTKNKSSRVRPFHNEIDQRFLLFGAKPTLRPRKKLKKTENVFK